MPRDPNVFFLSADSVRADAVREVTERLADRLDAVRFDDAVAPASHTDSSVPAMATGQFVDGQGPGLGSGGTGSQPGADGAGSIVEAFRRRGYETVCLTDNPLAATAIGEDSSVDGEETELWTRLDAALPRSTVRAIERAYFRRLWPLARRIGVAGFYYRPATTLHQRARERIAAADRPVFCWLHYMDAHHPYEPPPDDGAADDAAERLAARSRMVARAEYAPDESATGAGAGGAGGESVDLGAVRELYRETCESLGAAIESFLTTLECDGHLDVDRDVVAVTADHGECLDPGRGVVGHVPPASWESLVTVPLAVARPDWPAGSVPDQVSLIDLPRTLLDAVAETPGIEAPTALARERTITVSGTLGSEGVVRGIRRSDGTKLFARRTTDGVDVVRTEFDPGAGGHERVVAVGTPGSPPQADGLVRALGERGGLVGEASDRPAPDEDHLRALGYVE